MFKLHLKESTESISGNKAKGSMIGTLYIKSPLFCYLRKIVCSSLRKMVEAYVLLRDLTGSLWPGHAVFYALRYE